MHPESDEEPPPRRDPKVVLGLLAGLLVATALISWLLRPADVDPPLRRESSGLTAPGDRFAMALADADHGFAVRHSCNDTLDDCRQTLLVTADGGETWDERDLPERVSGRGALSARLSALGPCTLALDAFADQPTDVFRLFTTDCGRTWSRVSLVVSETVDAIPDGAMLEPCRIEVTIDQCSRGVIVSLPDSGRRVRLATVPDWNPMTPEAIPQDDGSWWLSGRNPASGKWELAVSRDDGRTWTESTLPGLPQAYVDGVPVTSFEEDFFATPNGGLASRFGLVALYHSTDDGRTWKRTWQADSGREPERLIGTALATPDGLYVTGDDASGPVGWRTRDLGRTFRKAGPIDELGTASRTRGGFLVTDDDSGRWFRSSDGVTWSLVSFPPDR